MNIFEFALRKGFRFPSAVGALSTEQLFSLPLTANDPDRPSLDNTAQRIFAELERREVVSFVTAKTEVQEQLNQKLDLVKEVITSKQAEITARDNERNRAKQLQILLGIKADQEALALKAMTPDALDAKIRELEADKAS